MEDVKKENQHKNNLVSQKSFWGNEAACSCLPNGVWMKKTQGSDIKVTACWTYQDLGHLGNFCKGGPGGGGGWGCYIQKAAYASAITVILCEGKCGAYCFWVPTRYWLESCLSAEPHKINYQQHCRSGWYVHPIKPDTPGWEHLIEYLSPHPSHVCNCAPNRQGLAHESPKLTPVIKQGPGGTIFFPLQSYPSSRQNHLAPFQLPLLDRSPGSLSLFLSCAHSSQNLSPCRHVIVTHSHDTFLWMFFICPSAIQ